MPLVFAITALVTLFVVVDPIGLAPTFLAVTEGLPRRARRDVAVRASLIAGAILIGTALIGDLLLRALGISLPAFRIAGGLLLFAIAFEMVLGVRIRREGQEAEEAVEERVPLGSADIRLSLFPPAGSSWDWSIGSQVHEAHPCIALAYPSGFLAPLRAKGKVPIGRCAEPANRDRGCCGGQRQRTRV
jgi:MarC family integral membrane protein